MAAIKQQHGQAGQPIPLQFSPAARAAWRDRLYAELDLDADEDTQLVLMCNRQPQQVCRIDGLVEHQFDGGMALVDADEVA